MLNRVLSAKIRDYAPANPVEQENVLQELMQHYVLSSLARAGMFAQAMFHGGTCLRIVYGMNRFSEGLDFLLKRPDPGFRWQGYLQSVRKDCLQEGIAFEVQDKAQAGTPVRKAFLKTDSIGKILTLDLPFERYQPRKIRIQLEIDTNPPAGSTFTTSYITFPVTAPVTTQSPESGFALKLHALLCRPYVKGRDWYDFVWYVARKTRPDLSLLRHALQQQGPWAGRKFAVTLSWVQETMDASIRRVKWTVARDDVQRFLPLRDQEGLRAWSVDFFLNQLARMGESE
ncbi:MAG: nucleotidyl transferase AbiEii/AbiGii toxin family protein [Betaproteobacteria bacterium]|nr:nucleotidyl transferase AbiEii/AbiGii toxin family protein [Betaproteobacteria bacterium]